MSYIIKNCPAFMKPSYCKYKCSYSIVNKRDGELIYKFEFDENSKCQDCTDCLLKRIYEDVKTVYRTPEYFEELAKKGDKEQETIESCWHNVSHMVISKLDVQEVN